MRSAEHLKAMRFPKGVSGNPKGRPKGAKDVWRPLSKDLIEILNEEIEVQTKDENGKVVLTNRTFKEHIMRKLASKAGSGDLKAIEMILDRTEGKATQTLMLDGVLTGTAINLSEAEIQERKNRAKEIVERFTKIK